MLRTKFLIFTNSRTTEEWRVSRLLERELNKFLTIFTNSRAMFSLFTNEEKNPFDILERKFSFSRINEQKSLKLSLIFKKLQKSEKLEFKFSQVIVDQINILHSLSNYYKKHEYWVLKVGQYVCLMYKYSYCFYLDSDLDTAHWKIKFYEKKTCVVDFAYLLIL